MDGVWKVPRAKPHRPAVSIVTPSIGRERVGMLTECMRSVADSIIGSKDVEHLVSACEVWTGDKVNDLVRISRGRLVTVLPDDDRLTPTFLSRCIDVMRGPFDFVYTNHRVFGDREIPHYELPAFGLNTFRQAVCPWTVAMMTRELWDELRGYDPDQDFQDTDQWVRAAKLGARAAHIHEPLWEAREHAAQGGRMMDHSSALLRLQSKHPDVYPSTFINPDYGKRHAEVNEGGAAGAPASENPFDVVPRVHIPGRYAEMFRAEGGQHA